MIAVRLIVTGKVQGVYFRQSTQDVARALYLSGFVMNLKDGTVLIEAQGDEEMIEALLSWCHKGPRFAKVVSVQQERIDLFEEYIPFQIRK